MSDRWIVIPKWEEFQAYKDRTVPWIKLYAELQHDEDWLQLSLRRRGILVSLWTEYMLSRCRLPGDTRSLSRRLNEKVVTNDLAALNDAGFIQLLSEPSPTHIRLMSDLARARAMRGREEKKRREETASADAQQPNPFTCEVCGLNSMRSKERLDEHLRNVHDIEVAA